MTAYYALKGTFDIEESSPDGDTVRFRPDHLNHLQALRDWNRIVVSKTKTLQVRLDGVDAPELHYEGVRQPRSIAPRTMLLRALGFEKLEVFDGWVLASRPRSVQGWIVASSVDIRGRVVAFVFPNGKLAQRQDGPIELTPRVVADSVNMRLIASGAAYLATYTSLAAPLRAGLREAARDARDRNAGVWSADSTRAFELRSAASIGRNGTLVMPKLFRRCASFCRDRVAGLTKGTFGEWLRAQRSNNDRVRIGNARATLSELIAVRGDRVSFDADLLQLVFVPQGG